MLTRRAFVRTSAALLLLPWTDSRAENNAAGLHFAPTAPVPLPDDFLGLGYEMSSVAVPGLLSAGNEPYVRLLRQLGAHGVVRVGGIVADYTRYSAEAAAVHEPQRTVINHAALEQFAGFLRKTGWTAIWSLPFAQGTLAEAAAEAQAVAGVLGGSLQAFELGNEVENYARGSRPFRRAPYRYDDYRAEYLRWHDAVAQVVPGARFAAPDTAGDVRWVEEAARDAGGELKGKVQLLTTHYYRNDQHGGSVAQLREPDPGLPERLARLREASRGSGLPWRMCEANSFSGGGLPGVSDTLLGALWTLDFLLLPARYGCGGVNLETGVNQLGFLSSYSPIRDDGRGTGAGAPYYGMLAFAQARRGCTHTIALDLSGAPETLTAYGLGRGARLRSAVLINRGEAEALAAAGELRLKHVSSTLTGDGGTGVRFNNGGERLRGETIRVPGMSALVVRP